METEENTPTRTPFEWIGGEARVKALVERFYDLMDLEPGYRELRAAHGSDAGQRAPQAVLVPQRLAGRPQAYYTDRFGHPRLRARTCRFRIGIKERDQWLACMDQAMADEQVDAATREPPAWQRSCRRRTGCATRAFEAAARVLPKTIAR
jgi:hemoglobin